MPYSEGLSESIKNICKKYGIQVHFKSGKSIKDELVAPKDKDHLTKKSGIIYRYKCDRLECDEKYIGETARTFGERYKEHLKAPSPIHCYVSGLLSWCTMVCWLFVYSPFLIDFLGSSYIIAMFLCNVYQ